MESFFSRYKNVLVLVIVLLAQVVGLAVQVKRPAAADAPDGAKVSVIRYWVVSLVAPPERILRWIGSSIRGTWSDYINLHGVRQQNQDLKAEVARLRLEQAGLLEDAKQGQRLQELLAFKKDYIYQTVAAQVIGTSGSDQSRVVIIDKGSADGLKFDMPVITPDGIVGKLRDVFPHTAQVLEINDQTSGAGVLLEATRIRGILRGNVYGQPQVMNVMPDDRIKPGERVLTSGGDQIYPRGLPVGVVERVGSDPDHEPYIAIIVKPNANLARLEEVLIITSTGGEMPTQERKDLNLSAEAGAAAAAAAAAEAEKKRASDVMAERLPGVTDPNAPVADQNAPPVNDTGIPAPVKAVPPLHPDHFSPTSTPHATEMTPGQTTHPLLANPPENLAVPTKKAVVPKPQVTNPDGTAQDGTALNGTAADGAPSGNSTTAKPSGSKPGTATPGTTTPGGATSGTPGTIAKPKPAGTGATGTTVKPKPKPKPADATVSPTAPRSTAPDPAESPKTPPGGGR